MSSLFLKKWHLFIYSLRQKCSCVFRREHEAPPPDWLADERLRYSNQQTFCSADALLFLSCQVGSSAAPPRARRRRCVCVCVVVCCVLRCSCSPLRDYSSLAKWAAVAVSPAHVLAVSIHYEIYLPGQTSPAARRTCRHPLLNKSAVQY